jgi:hypothetical protein
MLDITNKVFRSWQTFYAVPEAHEEVSYILTCGLGAKPYIIRQLKLESFYELFLQLFVLWNYLV